MGEDGHWRLSPAYDMGYPHNPNGGWTAMHQMSIAGNFENITKSDLLTFAKANNIKDANERESGRRNSKMACYCKRM